MKPTADMASSSRWGAEPFDGPTNEVDEIACRRCTLLNDKLAEICAVCGESLQHTDMTTDAGFICLISSDDDDDDYDGEILLSSDSDDGILCETCTLINKVGTVVCVACDMPLNANNKESAIAYTAPSSSHAYMDSFTGTKFQCGNCPFLNNWSATVCACCGFGLEVKKLKGEAQTDKDACQAESNVPGEHLIVCEACKENFGSMSTGHKLANCNHGFCRPCLSTAVVNNLLDLVKAEGTDQVLNRYECALRCPAEGCGCALSRRDLRLVVGPSTQHMLDEWLMTSITNQVVCPLVRCCPKCKDMERQLLVPPDQFHLLQRRSLRKAFACNSLTLPPGFHPKKQALAQHLKNAAPFSSLCSVCFLLVCQNCGAAPTPGQAHQCDPLRRQCTDITRSIMKLCFAYFEATWASKESRGTKKARVNFGFLSSDGESNPLTQSQNGDGLILNTLLKWFSVKDFEDMAKVQSRAAPSHDSNIGCSQKGKVSLVDTLAQSALDELRSIILQALSDNKDVLPPLVVALLCSHDLPRTLLKWLVSNDSIMDITARCDLYWAMLGFLGALSSSWDLLPLLCSHGAKHDCFAAQHRWQIPGSVMSDFENLFKQAQFMLRRGHHLLLFDNREQLGDNGFLLPSLVADVASTYELLCLRIMEWEGKTIQHPWSATPEWEGKTTPDQVSNSKASGSFATDQHQLYCLLQNLTSNQAFLSSSSTSLSKVSAHSMQGGAKLDLELRLGLGEHSRAMQDLKEGVRVKDSSPVRPAALVEAYKKALKPLQFDEARLLPTHYFRNEVTKSEAMMLNKRRARQISEEMTQLNTILPLEWESSIFLRVDEQRADVLRALIIGPEGTPYENGVFLFDLFLEHSYPDTPPIVQFLTTGGGKVRFNPNLYANGKVCLSLLGTWQGPGWMAGKSSIMQVLVSIQGLILVADPFFNEPGTDDHSRNRHAAVAYLRDQRMNTVQYSMLPALQNPDPFFLPVIRSHFNLKSGHILHQCTTWMHEDVSGTYQYKPLIEKLHHELDALNSSGLG